MNYSVINACRVCKGNDFEILKAFPSMPPAGLYKNTPSSEERLPLNIVYCNECSHVQLLETISPEIYKDYNYTGRISESLTLELKNFVSNFCESNNIRNKNILEIGSSDGVFLSFFSKENDILGFEPGQNLSDEANKNGIKTINDSFSPKLLKELNFVPDYIFVRHVLEHINDLHFFINGIKEVSEKNTFVVIEVPFLEMMIENNVYSNFFHEHLNYFSENVLTCLFAKNGFKVVGKYSNNIHGGSTGLVFQRKNDEKFDLKLFNKKKVQNFILNIDTYIKDLNYFLDKRFSDNTFIGFGAAQRTSFLIGSLNLYDRLKFVVDNNSFYEGKYIGGTNILIKSPQILKDLHGENIIIFAISYEDEIMRSNKFLLKENSFISIKSKPFKVIKKAD